jgi:hypothetical protein
LVTPNVPEHEFQGVRTVQAPSCESVGVGKREKVLIKVSEMSAQGLLSTAKSMATEGKGLLAMGESTPHLQQAI